MALEEKDYYAELGIEPPSQQPEAADPAGRGENDPSPAGTDGREESAGAEAPREEPEAGSETTQEEEPKQDEATEASGAPAPAQPMSRAERAEQARLRREREQKAAVDAAVLAARKEEQDKASAAMKALFASAGMVDRYHDNKPITTLEEFEAFQTARQADKLARELQGGRLTPESLQAAINNSPAVKAAQEAVEALKAKEQAETEAARKAEFEQRVKDELAEIHRMNPSLNSVEDVLALPTGDEFARLVRENGLSFLQAFKLANADSLAEARARAASEGAARNAASKSHLRSVNAGGQVAADVPPDVIANYRMFDPGISMEEIRRDYAKRYGK